MTEERYLIRAVIDRASFPECVAIDGRIGTRDELHEILGTHLSTRLDAWDKAMVGWVAGYGTLDFSPCRCVAVPLGHARERPPTLDDLQLTESDLLGQAECPFCSRLQTEPSPDCELFHHPTQEPPQ